MNGGRSKEGGWSALNQVITAKFSAERCSFSAQQFDVWSNQWSDESSMGIIVGQWHDPACHESDWDGTGPRPRPSSAGRGSNGAIDRAPAEETGRGKCFSPLTAGVLLRIMSLNAIHIASTEANGRGKVAFKSRYGVCMRVRNCPFTAIRTISNTTSIPGDEIRSLPVSVDKRTRHARL